MRCCTSSTRTDAGVERVAQQDERDAEEESEQAAEDRVPARLRLRLRSPARAADEQGLVTPKGLDGPDLPAPLLQRQEQVGSLLDPSVAKLLQLELDALASCHEGPGVDPPPVLRVRRRVRGREPSRQLPAGGRDREVQDVGIGGRRDGRVAQEPWALSLARDLERTLTDGREAGDPRLGGELPLRVALHDSRQVRGQVLRAQEHVCRRLIQVLLPKRDRDRSARDEDRRECDDPPSALQNSKLVAQSCVFVCSSAHAKSVPRSSPMHRERVGRGGTCTADRAVFPKARRAAPRLSRVCGIAASIDMRGRGRAMPWALGLLRHRGPDGAGSSRPRDGNVVLEHLRLAIIDPDNREADQPFTRPDRTLGARLQRGDLQLPRAAGRARARGRAVPHRLRHRGRPAELHRTTARRRSRALARDVRAS